MRQLFYFQPQGYNKATKYSCQFGIQDPTADYVHLKVPFFANKGF